jgi:hypothetical protein
MSMMTCLSEQQTEQAGDEEIDITKRVTQTVIWHLYFA